MGVGYKEAVCQVNTLLVTKCRIGETAEAGFGIPELSDFCQQHALKLQVIEEVRGRGKGHSGVTSDASPSFPSLFPACAWRGCSEQKIHIYICFIPGGFFLWMER